MVQGGNHEIPNYTADLLQRSPQKEFNIKWSAASMYAGGADTVGLDHVYGNRQVL